MCCVRSLSTFPVPPTVLMRMISVGGSDLLPFLTLLSQLHQVLEPIDPPPYHEPEAIKFPEPLKAPLPTFDLYDPSTPPHGPKGKRWNSSHLPEDIEGRDGGGVDCVVFIGG